MTLRFALALGCLIALLTRGVAAAPPPAKGEPTFNAHVRPIFQAYCTECHGEPAKPKGDLDLRLRRFAVKGGMSGPAIVPGKPADSILLDYVTAGEMPPGKKKLTKEQIDVIKRWIAAGAKVETEEPETLAAGFVIRDEDRNWWAFHPIKRPLVPEIRNSKSEIRNPIDAFLLQKLSEKGLGFNPLSDKVTLVRRVTLDLTGLPPTPAEIDAFAKDDSADAYEKVVDRLLASPHYGERWGRHWLDVAGYADSEGGAAADQVRNNAWKYRDYVIRSFNADKPFDQFIREQIAGDEMVKQPYRNLSAADLDRLIATGFLRMAPDGTGSPGVDQKLARNQVLTDTVKIVSSAFLGLTVGCAECHNHRYDPIPQTDFYRLRAFFEPALDPTNWKAPAARRLSLYTDADRKKAAEVEASAAKLDKERLKKQAAFIEATFEKELAKLPETMRDKARLARNTPAAKRNAEQKKIMMQHPSLNVSAGSLYLYDSKAAAVLKKMADEAAELRDKKPAEEFIRVLTESAAKLPTTFLFHRGDPDQPKEAVSPAGLAVLDKTLPLDVSQKTNGATTGRRAALANWLTDPKNPLTARVLANRIWMLHFGHGIAGSPGDFGRLGEAPTHPELLDWIAREFVARGWSVKHLHRLIVTSTAYRQSSIRDPKTEAVDPANSLLGWFPLRRLDAEAIRDSMMAVSGTLNSKMYGPPVPVKENEVGMFVLGVDTKDGAGRFTKEVPLADGAEYRRSIYVQVRRSRPLADLDTFDWAKTEPNCEFRNASTATPQALMLLNGEFILGQSEAFAKRLKKEAGTDAKAQVKLAWRLAYGKEPTAKELDGGSAFLKGAAAAFSQAPKGKDAKPQEAPADRALAAFCQAILGSNRFLYVE